MDILNHAFFRNAGEELQETCINRLNRTADSNPDIETDRERLLTELDAIIGNNYAPVFVLVKRILEWAVEARAIVFTGASTGSLLTSFYYGISYEKGSQYDYRLSMGYKSDRYPYLSVVIPPEFEPYLREKLNDTFGTERVHIKDGSLFVGTADYSKTEEYQVYWDCLSLGFEKSELLSDNPFKEYDEERFRESVKELFSSENYCDGIYGKLKANEKSLGLLKQEVKNYALACQCDTIITENIERVLNVIDGGAFYDVLKVLAMLRGSGLYDAYYQEEKGMLDTSGDFTRDGLFETMKKETHDDGLAYTITEKIRKGMGHLSETQDYMGEHGINEKMIERLSHLRYLVYQGSISPIASLLCYKAGCR